MTRRMAFIYGIACYVAFVAAFLYFIGFLSNFAVPKSIDSGLAGPAGKAVAVDSLLILMFAAQHSAMARSRFKLWIAQFLPAALERSTYVLSSSLALTLLRWQWEPIPAIVWQVENPYIADAVQGLYWTGWITVLTSTFLINHFELFGLHQVINQLRSRDMPAAKFRTPLLYKFVRHPLYLGFLMVFWPTPAMTTGHLLFAAGLTAYLVGGAWLEERDLTKLFGDEYRRYQQRVPMLVPWRRPAREQ